MKEDGILVRNNFNSKTYRLSCEEFIEGLKITLQWAYEETNIFSENQSEENKSRLTRSSMIGQAIFEALEIKSKNDMYTSSMWHPEDSFGATRETILAFEPWYCDYTKKPKSNSESTYQRIAETNKSNLNLFQELKAHYVIGDMDYVNKTANALTFLERKMLVNVAPQKSETDKRLWEILGLNELGDEVTYGVHTDTGKDDLR